jgi:general secretion pathway protein A
MYTEYYNLREQPFRLTPDPRFLHLATPHSNALNALLFNVILRKGFAVFTGPVGCGKTTVLHTLLELLAQRRVGSAECASALIVNPTIGRDDFFELLIDEFEIQCKGSNKAQRLLALEKKFREVDRRDGTCVLFVDEAHLLSIELLEEIRLLSNVDTARGKLLQVVLSGQLELLPLLDQPETRALKQRIATRCQIRPLTLQETRVYITERLGAAGLAGPSPFSSVSIETIHLYAQGIPRLINLMCDGCLTIGVQAQRSRIESDIVHEAATMLDLKEAPTEVERVERVDRLVIGKAPSSEESQPSALDQLIKAMKQSLTEVRS